MIYGVSISRGEGMGCWKKCFNPRTEILIKPSDLSSSSKSTQKGLVFYFVPDSNNAKVMDQLES